MLDIHEAEARMRARALLRDAYRFDVDLLAQEFAARIRRGEFDGLIARFGEILDGAIEKHVRLDDPALAFEVIAYSGNRNAIEEDFIEGWTKHEEGPWASFEVPIDPEDGFPCSVVLPPWKAIAYHAFACDVNARLNELLGDTSEQYIATRLGRDLK